MKRLILEFDWNYYKIPFFIVYICIDKIHQKKGEWVVDIKAFLRIFCQGVLKEPELIFYRTQIDILLKWKVERVQKIVNSADE
jgi:hypothetical protein